MERCPAQRSFASAAWPRYSGSLRSSAKFSVDDEVTPGMLHEDAWCGGSVDGNFEGGGGGGGGG